MYKLLFILKKQIPVLKQIISKIDRLDVNINEKINKLEEKNQQNHEYVVENISDLRAYDKTQDKTVDLKLKYIDDKTEEAVNAKNDAEWQSFEDLVFSLSPKQDKIYESLKAKNKEYSIEKKARNSLSGVIDGEVEVTAKDSFSVNEFLESDLCAVNGKRIVTQKDENDYKANFILKFTKGTKETCPIEFLIFNKS